MLESQKREDGNEQVKEQNNRKRIGTFFVFPSQIDAQYK